ncbi:MAG: LLM class flavin-dependent oxidoreductase [Gammaproteobacteria bacterium]|nr:LLM class flavin-dependent oxidoreductase [Gammaproteobacteria bacterium]
MSTSPSGLPIEFGFMDHTELRPGVTLDELFRERLEMLRQVEAAGFVRYHTTEHHLNRLDATPSPGLFLAAGAQHTSHIRLASLVHIVPFYHPLRLAEELIMLDGLTGGRLDVGVGKGISPPEHRLFGSDPETARERFEKQLDDVVLIMEGREYEGAPIPYRPIQQPYPPLWYAGNAVYAGERNMNTIVAGPLGVVVLLADKFRELINAPPEPQRCLNGNSSPTIGFQRHVYIDADGKRARKRAVASWSRYHDNLWTHFKRLGTSAPNNPTVDGDGVKALELGIIAAGTPEEVAEQLSREMEASGIRYMIGAFCWGDIDHTEALASVERFATQVIPLVRQTVG